MILNQQRQISIFEVFPMAKGSHCGLWKVKKKKGDIPAKVDPNQEELEWRPAMLQ